MTQMSPMRSRRFELGRSSDCYALMLLGQAGSGFCPRGFKCEQLSIRCRQPTRYLAYCIEERIRIGI